MSNQVYTGEMYNEEVKKAFLYQKDRDGNLFYSDETRDTYKRIFIRSFEIEKDKGKDLADFNLDEITEFLYSLQPKSNASSKLNIGVINSYIRWAIANGHRSGSSVNPFDTAPDKFYEEFVDRSEQMYFSKEEIDDIIEKAQNYQDKVVVSLIFEGVYGNGLAELKNLKETDIDFNTNTLKLTDADGSTREHVVSDGCIRLIKGAINETQYIRKSNKMLLKRKELSYIELLETGYVLKPTKVLGTEPIEEPVKSSLIYQRLMALSEIYKAKYLKSMNIRKSGMIYMGYLLLKRDGKLEKRQYLEIAERFNLSWILNGGTLQRNYLPLKDFVTIENIKELYGDI